MKRLKGEAPELDPIYREELQVNRKDGSARESACAIATVAERQGVQPSGPEYSDYVFTYDSVAERTHGRKAVRIVRVVDGPSRLSGRHLFGESSGMLLGSAGGPHHT